ncbi:MAG: hypothetical protein H2055_08105 [Sphingopyxis sp.]|nr:hypothetical protein [Sphingopyxis sp.]
MNNRVTELLGELASGGDISPQDVRNRIVDLFGEVTDESDRIALLAAFDAVMALAVRNVGDSPQLMGAIRADKCLLAMTEAMCADGKVDPERLNYVVEREISAGRMDRDSFAELTAAGAKVLGSRPSAGSGWIGRLFGR